MVSLFPPFLLCPPHPHILRSSQRTFPRHPVHRVPFAPKNFQVTLSLFRSFFSVVVFISCFTVRVHVALLIVDDKALTLFLLCYRRVFVHWAEV